MKNSTFLVLFLATPPFGMAQEEKIVSEPLGFNRVTCLANSDTIVGVPVCKTGSMITSLSASPSVDGGRATVTLMQDDLSPSSFLCHHLKFTSGAKSGFWYDITGCTSGSLTIDLNGDSLNREVRGEAVHIGP
jgi:uncharacterized protein (TIGR02597 family)